MVATADALPAVCAGPIRAAVGVLGLAYGSRVIRRLRVGDVAFEGQRREN